MATSFGIPVSTTHTITGSIVGVGSQKFSAVRWGGRRHCMGMGVYHPCSAFVAAVAWVAGGTFVRSQCRTKSDKPKMKTKLTTIGFRSSPWPHAIDCRKR